MNTLYLDMDGVLTDFEASYQKKFGEFPKDVSGRKSHFWENWKKWVDDREFESLPLHPGAGPLLEKAVILKNKGWSVEILSSSGGGYSHDLVEAQKKVWLSRMGLDFTANIVAGRRKKAQYARKDAILIDDTSDVISSFIEAGGKAIHHTFPGNTIETLSYLVDVLEAQ